MSGNLLKPTLTVSALELDAEQPVEPTEIFTPYTPPSLTARVSAVANGMLTPFLVHS